MEKNNFNDDDFYGIESSDDADIDEYAKELSLKPTTADEEPPKISATPQHKTFHSKKFIDSETQAKEDEKKSAPPEQKLKLKLSHAETSGVAISAVMFAYSLATQDKPLFFISTALLIFLLRPLIGGLFGEHNQAVQNALHSFSIVLFIGALLFLFLGS